MSCVLGETRQFIAALGDWSSAEESPFLGKFALTDTTEGRGQPRPLSNLRLPGPGQGGQKLLLLLCCWKGKLVG